MKRYFFDVSCGIGMGDTCVLEFEDDVTDEELTNTAYDLAVECANTYGSFWNEEDREEFEEDDIWGGRDFTDSDLDYKWALYDPEKHDRLRAGGGSFMDDF